LVLRDIGGIPALASAALPVAAIIFATALKARPSVRTGAAAVAPPQKFTALSRIFHWLTAILIFAALFIGFTMVIWLAGYAELRVIHMSIGALILLVVILRIVNRARHHPPAWPPTVGRLEGKARARSPRARGSDRALSADRPQSTPYLGGVVCN
jgi:hypothetical protein